MRDPVPEDWQVSAGGVAYPPEPWHLGGELLISAYRIPIADLPATVKDAVPSDHAMVVAGGCATVGAVFVRYVAGGVLVYDELMSSVLVRLGPRLRVTIPEIWVTSEASLHGGRELWGIPKQLGESTAEVGVASRRLSMSGDGRPIASLDARWGSGTLPGRLPIPLSTAQVLDGRRVVSVNSITGRLRTMAATWSFAPTGPLGYLSGRRPFANVAVAEAAIAFGLRVERA